MTRHEWHRGFKEEEEEGDTKMRWVMFILLLWSLLPELASAKTINFKDLTDDDLIKERIKEALELSPPPPMTPLSLLKAHANICASALGDNVMPSDWILSEGKIITTGPLNREPLHDYQNLISSSLIIASGSDDHREDMNYAIFHSMFNSITDHTGTELVSYSKVFGFNLGDYRVPLPRSHQLQKVSNPTKKLVNDKMTLYSGFIESRLFSRNFQPDLYYKILAIDRKGDIYIGYRIFNGNLIFKGLTLKSKRNQKDRLVNLSEFGVTRRDIEGLELRYSKWRYHFTPNPVPFYMLTLKLSNGRSKTIAFETSPDDIRDVLSNTSYRQPKFFETSKFVVLDDKTR